MVLSLGDLMPLSGYKSVTVPEEAYNLARQLAKLGLEDTIGKAFANAMKEYGKKREEVIEELLSVKAKWKSKETKHNGQTKKQGKK